ncbi:MAG: PfkB family carbohydrate kinase [Chloroflexota bacterium]|jgi:sugar/nucleoside kinase (ribokinase family)|nr:PfkB family carbohydrate kinase [Chloroflexota bacterium]MDH5243945.1 PfkB family carbohydrate kinase [Chloroflexota bacterium]
MIVVIGATYLRGASTDTNAMPGGLAGRVAMAAAAAGSRVELVSKVGEDAAGDALLLALTRAGVGHVAVLRDAVHRTELHPDPDDTAVDPVASDAGSIATGGTVPVLDAADVGLALRYLTDYVVIVAVHPTPAASAEAITAADWAGAHLVLVTLPGAPAFAALPTGSLVLEVAEEPDGGSAFGSRLGVYAAAVDRGEAPASAFAALTAEVV